MKITLSAARVYFSDWYVGASPLVNPLGEPILVRDFPARDERCYVVLGSPIEWMPGAERVAKAISTIALTGMTNPKTGSQFDHAITEVLDDQAVEPWGPRAANWYITLVVERDIEVPDDDFQPRQYLWLTSEAALCLEREFQAYAASTLDLLATYATTVIESQFFANLYLKNQVFFRCTGMETFRLFNPVIYPPGVVRHGGDADFENGRSLFQSLPALPVASYDWLQLLGQWRLAALVETDGVRRFLWNFITLELLVNRLCSMWRSQILEAIDSGSSTAGSAIEFLRSESDELKDLGVLSLGRKFAVVARRLCPEEADQDKKVFRKLARARNDLVHGNNPSTDTLPAIALKNLLDRYLKAAIDECARDS